MKTLILVALFAVAALGQFREGGGPYCHLYELRDAKAYFVIHNETTPASHRKKIEKAMGRASDLKKAKSHDAADFYIDFTEQGLMNVWRSAHDGTRIEIGRWSLVDSTTTMTLPGSARTTVVSAGRITTARTVITPARQLTIYTPGDIGDGSELLFKLRVARKLWRKMPAACL